MTDIWCVRAVAGEAPKSREKVVYPPRSRRQWVGPLSPVKNYFTGENGTALPELTLYMRRGQASTAAAVVYTIACHRAKKRFPF